MPPSLDRREDVRFRVMRLLEANPHLSQRTLAREVGISTGSVHYVLGALVDAGLVKLGKFSAAADKRRYAYILTPRGIAEKARITRRFLERKMHEYEALRSEIALLHTELATAESEGERHMTPEQPCKES